MWLRSDTFAPYGFLPERTALGKGDPVSRFTFAGNRSPHLAWGDVPEGTRSFALIAVDPEAPSVGTDVNQPGREVAVDLPRAPFFHWVVLDLPSDLRALPEGAHGDGVKMGGKSQDAVGPGIVGVNDYTGWFAAETGPMKGQYYGYDGAGPPWNDQRMHAYVFTIYALNVPSLGMHGSFDGPKALAALRSHVLATASLTGLYAIHPGVRAAHADAIGR
ncbi:MAG: hypothetical protein RLZZ383_2856 [Pseudomonadota bacterium]|jgi:Raf kinase inhibitor-like YbhB/YbcL family protein